MGYNTGSLDIYVRLDNHLDERTQRGREAAQRLKDEINMLIESDPDYERVATLGCCGGY